MCIPKEPALHGIACIELQSCIPKDERSAMALFVMLMIQSTAFYLLVKCITIVRDDGISFLIQDDPSRKTTNRVWGTVRILGM